VTSNGCGASSQIGSQPGGARAAEAGRDDTLQQRLHDCEAQRNTLLAENAALKQRSDQLMVIMAKLSQDKIALLTLVRSVADDQP